jgi:hypothetical protein
MPCHMKVTVRRAGLAGHDPVDDEEQPEGDQEPPEGAADHRSLHVVRELAAGREYVERIEDLDAALRRAQARAGPSLVSIRSDRDANRAIPADMAARFFEVYLGPAAQPTPASDVRLSGG